MKKLMFILVLLMIVIQCTFAQTHFRFSAGISPGTNPVTTPILVNKSNKLDQFFFNMTSVKSQMLIGVTAITDVSDEFFLETNLFYTKKQTTFQCDYILGAPYHPQQMEQMDENEHLILLPVSVGYDLGLISVTSGLSGTILISKDSELSHMDGFTDRSPLWKTGWQTGVKLKLGNCYLGVEYQSQLSCVGNGMSLNDQPLRLGRIPGQFVLNFQYEPGKSQCPSWK